MFYINVLLFHIFYGQSYKVQGQYVHLKEKISSDVFVFYLCNNGQTGGKSGIDINVVPAWDLVEGNSAITVAVIDQGVDKNHEDLSYDILLEILQDLGNRKMLINIIAKHMVWLVQE